MMSHCWALAACVQMYDLHIAQGHRACIQRPAIGVDEHLTPDRDMSLYRLHLLHLSVMLHLPLAAYGYQGLPYLESGVGERRNAHCCISVLISSHATRLCYSSPDTGSLCVHLLTHICSWGG